MSKMIEVQEDASKEVLEVLQVHIDFLRAWEADPEYGNDGAQSKVEDYWELPGDDWHEMVGWNITPGVPYDPPRLVMDWTDPEDKEDRIIQLRATPYHDEGGPSQLTGFFELDNGVRWVQSQSVETGERSGKFEKVDEERWVLKAVLCEFDTIHSLLFTDGKLNEDVLPGKTKDQPSR